MRKRLLLGALAGALGGVAIKAVVRFLDRNSFGLNAATDIKTARKIWRRSGLGPLDQKNAEQIGAAMHYGFAIVAGVLYAAMMAEFSFVRRGRGTVFGAALWLIGDEVAVSASGLENPLQSPMFSHFSALSAHILYGMIVDAVASRSNL